MGHEPHQRSDSGQNDDGRYPASTVASELHSSFRLLSGLVVDNSFVSSWRSPDPPVIADVQAGDIILRAKVSLAPVVAWSRAGESACAVDAGRETCSRSTSESPRCPHTSRR